MAQHPEHTAPEAEVLAPEQEWTVEALHAALTAAEARVASLESQLSEAAQRAQADAEQVRSYAAAYDKAKAEFAAARERQAREYERNLKRDQVKAVSGLLTVLDTLDRSLQSVQSGQVGDAFVDGVRMIRSQFEQALGAMGLQRFDGMGETFDPTRHEAVTTMNVVDPSQDGKVVHVVAAGCMLGDEVVRPASVVVGKMLN